MREFTILCQRLEQSTRNRDKVGALKSYFAEAAPEDASWAVFFLSGRAVPKVLSLATLREFIVRREELPLWLVEESSIAVGDLAETLALLLTPNGTEEAPSLSEIVRDVLLVELPDEEREKQLKSYWDRFAPAESFLFHKLLTGGFRFSISQSLLTQALSELSGVESDILAYRLMGDWEPGATQWMALMSREISAKEFSAQPYPFFLGCDLEGEIEGLRNPAEWSAEFKWDGLRAQLVKRGGTLLLFSRDGENLTEKFPEVVEAIAELQESCVLDGELLAWRDEAPLSFQLLRSRLSRKKISRSLQRDIPAKFIAYDCLEREGRSLREEAFRRRREELVEIGSQLPEDEAIGISPLLEFRSWDELRVHWSESRRAGVDGLILKRLDAPYGVGRKQGDWVKWKVEPLSILAVLLYAQKGQGRRASLFSEYTLAVWDEAELIPIAKVESELGEAELLEVDRFIRGHTKERFGPVRRITPELVFELTCSGGELSPRHRAGFSLRSPRVIRRRKDKKAPEADSLEHVRSLLALEKSGRRAVRGRVR